MEFKQVKKYWDERASSDSSAQSTTMDFYLREIEFNSLRSVVSRYKPGSIMDVGCGDARTTARLAEAFPEIIFTGIDYSEVMTKNAERNINNAGLNNLDVVLCDISRQLHLGNLDMIYTTRCLINLTSWELQEQALRNIADSLSDGGVYVMIENFVEGQQNFNRVRHDLGLPEIKIRDHNLFFHRQDLIDAISDIFEIVDEVNISSTYYLVSRGIYSKICQEKGVEPDYFDVHHKYAAQLPFCGEFGPVRMLCMKKRR